MMFDIRPTLRGLLRAEFRDRYGSICSVQESSFPDEDCLWLGVEVGIDGTEVSNGRMHLSREMAKELLLVLRYFARTGKLGLEDVEKEFHVGAWVRGVGPDNQGVEGRVVHTDDTAITVQGPDGVCITLRSAVALYWEPMPMPEHVPSRYERMSAPDENVQPNVERNDP